MAGIAAQAFREMEMGRGRISQPCFDTTQVIFCAIPVLLVGTLPDELKQSSGFIEFANFFEMGCLIVNRNSRRIWTPRFHTSDISEAFENAA